MWQNWNDNQCLLYMIRTTFNDQRCYIFHPIDDKIIIKKTELRRQVKWKRVNNLHTKLYEICVKALLLVVPWLPRLPLFTNKRPQNRVWCLSLKWIKKKWKMIQTSDREQRTYYGSNGGNFVLVYSYQFLLFFFSFSKSLCKRDMRNCWKRPRKW